MPNGVPTSWMATLYDRPPIMVRVKDLFDLEVSAAGDGGPAPERGYVFGYDPYTAAALEQASGGRLDPEPPR